MEHLPLPKEEDSKASLFLKEEEMLFPSSFKEKKIAFFQEDAVVVTMPRTRLVWRRWRVRR